MPVTVQHEEDKNSGDEDHDEPEESSNRESENREGDKFDDRLQEKVDDIKASKICGALLNLHTLVTEIFLEFSPHERAAREPRSGENTSREKENQEKPLGPG